MWNTSADYLTGEERYAQKQGIIRSNSKFNLFLGNPAYAIEVKQAAPDKEVCYREYWPDPSGDGDNSVHLRPGLTPEALAQYHLSRVPAHHNIWHHGGNEPALTTQLIDFSLRYAKEIIRLGGKAILLNLSVGTPEKADWAIAAPLLRYVAQYRDRLWIGLHEYSIPLLPFEFSGKDAIYPHQWPEKVNGSSWLLGRYRELFYYCDRAGISRPYVVFTEFGWDYIHAAAAYQDTLPASGGCNKTGGMWCNLDIWHRWLQGTDMSIEEYAYRQIQWAWDAIYRHDKEVKGFAFFCYGHYGKWDKYDAKLATDFVNRMTQGNWTKAMATTPPTPTVTPTHYVCATDPTGVNVRADTTTTAKVLHVVSAAGELAKLVDSKALLDGKVWDKYTFLNGVTGWVRTDVRKHVALKPTVTLNVPYKAQYGDTTNDARINDCAAACIAMLMGFEGVDITVDEVTAAINQPEGTVHFRYLIPAIQTLGFKSEVRQGSQLVDIIRSLNEGRPMMTLVNYEHLRGNADYRYGHFVVPIGYSFESQTLFVELHDPYNAASMEYPALRFARAIGEMAGMDNSAFQSLFFTGRVDVPDDPPPLDVLAVIRQHAAEIVRLIDTIDG